MNWKERKKQTKRKSSMTKTSESSASDLVLVDRLLLSA